MLQEFFGALYAPRGDRECWIVRAMAMLAMTVGIMLFSDAWDRLMALRSGIRFWPLLAGPWLTYYGFRMFARTLFAGDPQDDRPRASIGKVLAFIIAFTIIVESRIGGGGNIAPILYLILIAALLAVVGGRPFTDRFRSKEAMLIVAAGTGVYLISNFQVIGDMIALLVAGSVLVLNADRYLPSDASTGEKDHTRRAQHGWDISGKNE